jgi:hypothetical protein
MNSAQLAGKAGLMNVSGCVHCYKVIVSRFPSQLLLDHTSRILVVSQTSELCMAQVVAFGPFQEFNLGYQFGIDPTSSSSPLSKLRPISSVVFPASRFQQIDKGTFNPR